MLGRVIDGIGFLVSGARQGSRQTILFIVGGVLTLAGGFYIIFRTESIRRCWNFLMDSWLLDVSGQDDDFIEDALRLRDQNTGGTGSIGTVVSCSCDSDAARASSLPRGQEVLLSLRDAADDARSDELQEALQVQRHEVLLFLRDAADDARSGELQEALQVQQAVLTGLLQPNSPRA